MTATLAFTGNLQDIHSYLLTLPDGGPHSLTMTLRHDPSDGHGWTVAELERVWRELPYEAKEVLKMMAEKPNRIETSEIRDKLSLPGPSLTPVDDVLKPFRERGELLKKVVPGGSTRTYPVDQRNGAYKTDLAFAILVLIISKSDGA